MLQAECQASNHNYQALTSGLKGRDLHICHQSFIAAVPRQHLDTLPIRLTSAATNSEGSIVAGPIDEFCESLRSELHARRAKSRAELEHLRQLVHELELARESAFVAAFAAPLNLRVPPHSGASESVIHSRLLNAVQALNEAAPPGAPRGAASSPSASSPAPTAPVASARPAPSKAVDLRPTPERAGSNTQLPKADQGAAEPFPTLQRLGRQAPIVVVGGSRGEKLAWLPLPLRQTVEWIETTRQGTHAIGNLAQRIRQRRVLALIVLDGVVGHKHSEPLVAAAREVKIPTAYANKGGTGTLARAFTQLEKMVGAP